MPLFILSLKDLVLPEKFVKPYWLRKNLFQRNQIELKMDKKEVFSNMYLWYLHDYKQHLTFILQISQGCKIIVKPLQKNSPPTGKSPTPWKFDRVWQLLLRFQANPIELLLGTENAAKLCKLWNTTLQRLKKLLHLKGDIPLL